MGARLRLKTNVGGRDPALRTADPNVQKIFRAMQKYGLIVADNGSDMFITGTFDTRWDNNILNPAFSLLSASDFDVIQLGWQPTVSAPALASISASPNPVVGGNPSTGTVTLTAPATANLNVALSSASKVAVIPASVTVLQGASSATFGITTSSVATQNLITLSASYANVTKTTTLTVNPAATGTMAALALNPAIVVGGSSSTGTVTLTGPAPANGARATLTSSMPTRASVPASVVVPAGSSSQTFTVTTTAVRRDMNVTISASYAGITQTATLTVKHK
jgi:hypothetical protein